MDHPKDWQEFELAATQIDSSADLATISLCLWRIYCLYF